VESTDKVASPEVAPPDRPSPAIIAVISPAPGAVLPPPLAIRKPAVEVGRLAVNTRAPSKISVVPAVRNSTSISK